MMENNKLDIRVYPIDEPKGSTKAYASIAVGDLVAIRGIRVVDGEKGMFAAMPQSYDKKTEKYHDIAFPLTKDLREDINAAVIGEYNRVAAIKPELRGYDKTEMNVANGADIADVKLEIRIYPLDEQKGNVKAFASVSVDDIVAIKGIRVIDGKNGLFTAMPQSRDKNGEHRDIAFPINGDLRKAINKAVLEQYATKDRSHDTRKTLSERLSDGAEKASRVAESRAPAAKSRQPSMLA
jgi:stage V sporulation protein G